MVLKCWDCSDAVGDQRVIQQGWKIGKVGFRFQSGAAP